MKLARLLDNNLHLALKQLNEQPLPLKTAFLLKGIQGKMQAELIKYEEVRKEALTRFGKKDEQGNLVLGEGNAVVFEDGKQEEFLKELSALLNEEIDCGKLSVDQLGDIKITVDQLVALDGLIE